jgi:hypothetical protein
MQSASGLGADGQVGTDGGRACLRTEAIMHLTDGVGSCARCWTNLHFSLKTDFNEGVHDASTPT